MATSTISENSLKHENEKEVNNTVKSVEGRNGEKSNLHEGSRSQDKVESRERERSSERDRRKEDQVDRKHNRSRSYSRDRRRRSSERDYRKRSLSRDHRRRGGRSRSTDRHRRRRYRSDSRSRKRRKSSKKSKKKKRDRSEESKSEDDGNDSEEGLTEEQKLHKKELERLTRDARTVFVSQLQVKVTEKDLKKFFQAVCDVKDVVLIRDRFTNRSKGFGYVEVKTLEDVPKALMLTGQRFIFRNGKQGFPISVKASEAEKNFTHQLEKRVASMSRAPTGAQLSAGAPAEKPRSSRRDRETSYDDEWDDRLVVANIHPNIQESQLRELCTSFGAIKKLELVHDREGKRNGSANIYFEQSIDAMKAFKELDGLELAGLKLEVSKMKKTPSEIARERRNARRSDDERKENMDSLSWRLEDDEIDVGRVGGGGVSMNSHTRASLMSKLGGGLGEDMLQQSVPVKEKPPEKKDTGPGRILGVASRYLCIKNMFDPRTETEPNWENAIEEDTKMECENFGQVLHCAVDSQSAGHVYVMFETIQAGVDASHALHGRWFAKRLVQVEYLKQDAYEAKHPEAKNL